MRKEDLPEQIKQQIGNRYVYHAEETEKGFRVELSCPEAYINISEIKEFYKDGMERYTANSYKLEARIDGEQYEMYDGSVYSLLRRLVNALGVC